MSTLRERLVAACAGARAVRDQAEKVRPATLADYEHLIDLYTTARHNVRDLEALLAEVEKQP